MTTGVQRFLSSMRKTALIATQSQDSTEKWEANAKLLSWFRSDPEAILEALQAAAAVSARPGGINHTRLHEAIANLPKGK